MTSYVLRKAAPERTGTDVLVVGMTSSAKGPQIAAGGEAVASAFGRRLRPLLSTLGFEGKPGQTASVPSADQVRAPLVLVTGLGDEVTPTSVRRATGVAARAVRNAASVALALPADEPALVTALVEGYALGSYSFDGYRTKPESDRPGEVVILSEGARRAETTQAFEAAQVVAAAVARTRDWVNTPAADLRPGAFADAVVATNKARKATKGPGRVTVKVFDEEALAEEGCGGILGVGRGSDAPPRMVRLTYQPADAHAHLALVGKGITFDSGGLSIKPGASMTTMKMDMAGAATVVNATFAIADLGLPVKVTTFAPMAENMLSGSATRPGDVLTMYGGRTVEVLNTDAEGRLVLADALVHAVEAKPDYVVDVATLTGACVIALGDRIAGLFGNDDAWIDAVAEAAGQAGEAVWRMPIPDEMGEKVRGNSKIADLAQHNTERWGGASYAAAFLREFVDGRPWTHIDIAGPAYNEKGAYGYVTPGGTGFGVATLVALAQDLAGD